MMPRAGDVAADPVIALRMEPLRLALQGTADRMQHGMMRAAVSSIARESGDCAAALFLPDGRLLAQARSLPLLLGSLIPAVAGVLARFPLATMSEGDAYLLNDPWSGGTHLPDLALVHPVFHDGEVIAFAAANLHHQDVGGMAAGSIPPDATEVYQEGLRLPPVRWRSAEGVRPDIDAILAANSRTPDNLRGDLEAQWTALTQGARELKQIARHTGPRFPEVCDALIAQTERMTRAALSAAPDGEWSWHDQLDGDGVDAAPVAIVVSLRKQGDALVIDFEGSAKQVRGPLNASPAAMLSAALFFMRTLAPHAPNNAGCLAPLTLKLPPGSLVNPKLPAAVNARTATVKLACNAILGAWSQSGSGTGVAPHAGVATVLALSGTRTDGQRWMFTEIIASGAGASVHAPGRAGVSTDVGNARNTPVEVIETEAPLRVECYEIRRGSGGAGLQCGGDGVRRAYRLLEGQGWIAYRGERHVGRARGAQGGEAGVNSVARVLRVDGAVEHLPARARIAWSTGDLLIIETAGGGGWGRPAPAESANPPARSCP
ncbi:hydantoinase B/oxoprolinase family protein [Bradyrhizobium sp. 5.13L]